MLGEHLEEFQIDHCAYEKCFGALEFDVVSGDDGGGGEPLAIPGEELEFFGGEGLVAIGVEGSPESPGDSAAGDDAFDSGEVGDDGCFFGNFFSDGGDHLGCGRVAECGMGGKGSGPDGEAKFFADFSFSAVGHLKRAAAGFEEKHWFGAAGVDLACFVTQFGFHAWADDVDVKPNLCFNSVKNLLMVGGFPHGLGSEDVGFFCAVLGDEVIEVP